MSQRTLVLHTGALGDFLLACPAIEVLAKQGPVELVGHPERHAVAVAAGIAARSHPLDELGLHEVFATPTSHAAPSRFRAFVQHFDRVVAWMSDQDGALTRAFCDAGVRSAICRPGLPPADWPSRVSDYYLNTIGAGPVSRFELNFPPRHGLDVILAPGSGSSRKNWPLEHFLAIAEALKSDGHRVTWLKGPAEEAMRLPESATVLGGPPLDLLASQMAGAHLYIGNDSGPTHLASLAGCRTVALFGPEGQPRWQPIGPRTEVLSGEVWPEVTAVLATARRLLSRTRI